MTRSRISAVLVLLCLPLAARPDAAPGPAPLYALPPDGTWVEYVWKGVAREGVAVSGVLRISSVGTAELGGSRRRWVEVKLTVGSGKERTWKLRKLLVTEAGLRDGLPRSAVTAVYALDAGQAMPRRLAIDRADVFLGLGFGGAGAALRPAGAEQEVSVPLGKFSVRPVTAKGEHRGRWFVYDAHLTDSVPFGWARCAVHEAVETSRPRLVFTAEASRSGRDAQPEMAVPTPAGE
jgi:hypothetical protein